jgi:hypothetical protein
LSINAHHNSISMFGDHFNKRTRWFVLIEHLSNKSYQYNTKLYP